MMKFRKNQKGFTLIEALIVVIIVAILAALGIARFLGTREATALATCQSHQSTLNAALKKFDLEHPTTPFSNATGQWATVWADAGSPACPDHGTVATHSATGYYYPAEDTVGSNTEWITQCDNATHNLVTAGT